VTVIGRSGLPAATEDGERLPMKGTGFWFDVSHTAMWGVESPEAETNDPAA
jgi:hypothetical protein